ncbi:MAG: hypothetical protein Kilf2KO_24240 [Rhodospirillales bacterium]
MAVITRSLGSLAALAGTFASEDHLRLTAEERASPHLLARTEAGRELRISFPRDSELNDGDVLAIEEGVAIVVRAAPEALYVIRPTSALNWGVAGFQLGNLHRPVRFTEDALLTPADPMVADIFARLEIAYEERITPFVGKRYGSFVGHHHDH